MICQFRTIIALGHLVMSCDQTLYVKLINILMEELENPQGQTQDIRTYIQVNRIWVKWEKCIYPN